MGKRGGWTRCQERAVIGADVARVTHLNGSYGGESGLGRGGGKGQPGTISLYVE